MKKYILSILTLLPLLVFVSCQANTLFIAPVSAAVPVISGYYDSEGNEISSVICEKDSDSAISVRALVTDGGNLSYIWYVTDTNGETLKEASQNSVFDLNTSVLGDYSLYVEVVNTNLNANERRIATAKGPVIPVTVREKDINLVDAAIPVFVKNLDSNPVFLSLNGEEKTYTVEVSLSDEGELSYQWYVNGTAIENANTASITPSSAEKGTFEYYVVVTNTNENASGKKTASCKSEHLTIIVQEEVIHPDAQLPYIDEEKSFTSEDAVYPLDSEIPALKITAVSVDGGLLSYQWYKDGKAISGAVENSYVPDSSLAGLSSYYVVVTNTIDVDGEVKSASYTSGKKNITIIRVTEPSKPEISESWSGSVSYTKGSSASPLSVSATANGQLSYQWYKKASGDEDFSSIDGATSESYTPDVSAAGDTEYYVIVTNTVTDEYSGESKTNLAISKTVLVSVSELVNAAAPYFEKNLEKEITYVRGVSTASALEVLATVSDGGRISYTWYLDDVVLDGVTGNSYEPAIDVTGKFVYYVKATNTIDDNEDGGQKTASTNSNKLTLTVRDLKTADQPKFVENLSTSPVNYPANHVIAALSVVASVSDEGELSYQWYKSSASSDFEAITGATEASYTPLDSESGTYTYYVKVTNTIYDMEIARSSSIDSNYATVVINPPVNAAIPEFLTNFETVETSFVTGSIAEALEIVADVSDDGELSYQWYVRSLEGDYEAIPGAVEDSYTPSTTTSGTYIYKVIVTNRISDNGDGGDKEASAESGSITITIREPENAERPVVVSNFSTVSGTAYSLNSSAQALTVTGSVSDGGQLSYQWYKKAGDGDFELISGATSSSYTPSTTASGTFVYKVIVTNTISDNGDGGMKSASTESGTVLIIVNEKINALSPVIDSTNFASVKKDYACRENASPLTVSASSSDSGTLSYKWYISSDGITFEEIPSAVSASYTPVTSSAGTFVYKVIVTNTITDNGDGGVKTASTASGTVTVLVNQPVNAASPVISENNFSTVQTVYALNANCDLLSVTASSSDGGSLTYQWYKNGAAIPSATSASYKPLSNAAGSFTYKLEITNTISDNGDGGAKSNITETDPVTITINEAVNAQIPVISSTNFAQVTTSYTSGESASGLSVTATVSDDGALSYQWYKNGALIEGANSSTYTPSTELTGSFVYKVIVTNTITDNGDGGVKTASTESGTVTITVEEAPVINASQPILSTNFTTVKKVYVYNEATSALTVVAFSSDADGRITYQWYKKTGSSEFLPLSGETGASITPASDTAGIFIYKVVVTNTIPDNNDGGIKVSSAESSTVEITVNEQVNAAQPVITESWESNVSYSINTEADALTVHAAADGNLTYQWYSRSGSDDFTQISGAVSNSYTPLTDNLGSRDYYVVITNTIADNGDGGVKSASITSSTVTVMVVDLINAGMPVITENLSGETVNYARNETALPLSVVASSPDGGSLSYQWYVNNQLIEGAVTASYRPVTTTPGTYVYLVRITNTNNSVNGSKTAVKSSSAVTVVVAEPVDALSPVISGITPVTSTYDKNALASAITVQASSSDGGTLSYRWYKKNAEDNFELIEGETSSSYVPVTGVSGTFIYKVIVTNSITDNGDGGIKTASSESQTVTVVVNPSKNALSPVITETNFASLPVVFTMDDDAPLLSVTASSSDAGTLSYQWYVKSGSSEFAEIEDAEASSYEPEFASTGTFVYKVRVINTITDNGDGGVKSAFVESETFTLTVNVVNASVPSLVTNFDSVKTVYIANETSEVLTVTATKTDNGVLSYQWYKDGEVIEGAIQSYYSPLTVNTSGSNLTNVYKVRVTNTISDNGDGGEKTSSVYSGTVSITINKAENALAPQITGTNFSTVEKALTVNDEVETLSVTAVSPDDGELSYAWYKASGEEDFVRINGASNSSYKPVFETAGTYVYKVVVTNTIYDNGDGGLKTAQTASETVTYVISAINAASPVLTTNFNEVTRVYDAGDTPSALTVTAIVSDSGVLSYQWYKDGVAIAGAVSASYLPSTENTGDNALITAYKVVVTNTISDNGDGGVKVRSSESDNVIITVNAHESVNAETPVLVFDSTAKDYFQNQTASALSVSATVTDGGVLTYQWLSKIGSRDFEVIEGAVSSSYTPSTANVGSVSYKVVVTNTIEDNGDGGIKSVFAETASVIVRVSAIVNAQVPVIDDFDTTSLTYKRNASASPLSVTASVSDDGTLSYQWYVNDEAIENANAASYTPVTTEAGSFVYKVVVTNTIDDNGDGGEKTASRTSGEVVVVVNPSGSIGFDFN